MRVGLRKTIQTLTFVICPKCKGKLHEVGLMNTVLWCNKCKQAYFLELRKANIKEEELKDVFGFPKQKRDK